MNILNVDEFSVKIQNTIEDAVGETKGIHISSEPVLNKEKNGSIYYKIEISKGQTKKKVALYIFERKNGITTFIINGDTMDLLFENATIKSPEISLTYLKQIIEGNIKWILNTKSPKKFNGGKKPFNKAVKKPFKKPGNSGKGNKNYSGKSNKPYGGKAPYKGKTSTSFHKSGKPYVQRGNIRNHAASTCIDGGYKKGGK